MEPSLSNPVHDLEVAEGMRLDLLCMLAVAGFLVNKEGVLVVVFWSFQNGTDLKLISRPYAHVHDTTRHYPSSRRFWPTPKYSVE